jgi:hypothetical protein
MGLGQVLQLKPVMGDQLYVSPPEVVVMPSVVL